MSVRTIARGVSFVVGLALCCALAAGAASGPGAESAESAVPLPSVTASAQLQNQCELGITLALSGENAKAESVFVSLLSRSPGDPRALTNLGNIYMIRGEPDLALAFYERAAAKDTSDAGIVLNEAVAFMLLNDAGSAESRASLGIEKAGGTKQAASLLGLRASEQEDESRGADKVAERPHVAKSEIASLLSAAKQSVPTGSAGADTEGIQPEKKRPEGSFRSAGTRASGETVMADMIYWKR